MIIVSLTSFPERINQVNQVILSILNLTLKPDLIVLTLSLDEFPNKEISLELTELEDKGLLKIKWVEGNEYAYKKLIHTLKDYPNDLIITMDDDVIYNPDIIKLLVNKYYENGERNPITGGWYSWKWCHRCASHHGRFSLTSARFYGNYIFELYDKYIIPILKTSPYDVIFDDTFYTLCAALNGVSYVKADCDCRKLPNQFNIATKSRISDKSMSYKIRFTNFAKYLIDVIQKEYNKNIIDEVACNLSSGT